MRATYGIYFQVTPNSHAWLNVVEADEARAKRIGNSIHADAVKARTGRLAYQSHRTFLVRFTDEHIRGGYPEAITFTDLEREGFESLKPRTITAMTQSGRVSYAPFTTPT